MDNGEVIPGLNESWTLGGAKLGEWMAGFMALIIASEVLFTDKLAKSMPALMLIWVGTTFGMAALRRMYPDEERGLRNQAMVAIGVPPPGIPLPAQLQPYWSGFPAKDIDPKSEFAQLNLNVLFENENGDEGIDETVYMNLPPR